MSKITRFFGGTAFATVLLLGVGALSPQAAQAASLTPDQISAIVGLLQSFGADQSVINNVQVALGGTVTGGGTQPWCHTFNRDLTVGSTGADVSALNQALSASGIDTSGNTSTFDEITASYVVQFQAKYGIRQTGYVGPITRAKLNKLYGCSNPVPPSTFSASPTSGGAPLAVMFYSDARGGTTNFGDGTPNTQMECDNVSAANSSSVSSACLRTFTSHTYTTPGTYTATLQVLPQCTTYVGQTDFSNCKPVTIGKVTIMVTSKTGTLSINPTSAGIKVGGTTTFQAMYQPPMPPCPIGFACAQVMPNLLPVQATWTSSNSKVATVAYKNTCPAGATCFAGPDYLTAVVTGISLGSATITATYKDSSGVVLTAGAPVSTVMQ